MTRFALCSFATLMILDAATAIVSRHIARDEAIRDARTRSEGIARSVAASIVNAAVRGRDLQVLRTLGDAVEARMRYGSASHIVLWDTEGRILWAEDPELVGMQFALSGELDDLAFAGASLLEEFGDGLVG